MNRLMGRNSIENALLRLDSLTKEENLMTMAKTFEVTHRIDGGVKEDKALAQDVNDNVRMIKKVAQSVDHSVKATKYGKLLPLFIFIHVPTLLSRLVTKQ
jgi:hypothetical protein